MCKFAVLLLLQLGIKSAKCMVLTYFMITKFYQIYFYKI